MSWSRTLIVLLAASAWPLSCCCEEPECGDDTRDPGELCFLEERVEVDLELDMPLALRGGLYDDDELGDLLVIGTDETGVTGRLLLGDGDGLAKPGKVAVSGCSAYPIAGDLDGDGRHDLVFATCTNGLVVYRATDQGFTAGLEIPVGVAVRQGAIADVDGDGLRDILVLGVDGAGVPALSFAQALTDGTFAPAYLTPQPVPALESFEPNAMATGRVQRDGRFEIVFAEAERPGGLARTHYVGKGTFAPPEPLTLALRPAGLALRDLDNDDRLDLITADRAREELAVVLDGGDPDGIRTPLEPLWQSFSLGQMDDDGWLDLVLIREERVEIRRGTGDGSFNEGIEVLFTAPVIELALIDLNGDGRDDLIAGTFAGDAPLTITLSGP
ncbi:MAG TPA: VCBS repeat-containing protein [Nannocystis sp.]|jgi:hypothetical protein